MTTQTKLRKPLAIWLVFLMLVQPVLSAVVHAQTIDLIAPTILGVQHSVQGNSSVIFRANITDNNAIGSATLFYRTDASGGWQRVVMSASDGDEFEVRLLLVHDANTIVQYYVQAEDAAGNRVSNGDAETPKVAVVTPPSNLDVAAASLKAEEEDGWGWGRMVGGLLIAAAVVKLAEPTPKNPDPTDPVTTGSITVAAPTP